MTSRVVYWNGEFIPESEAKLSIYDSALMFGDMVFEMTRSFNKKQFMLREHLDRLYKGLNILQIPLTMTIDEMEKACLATIDANDHLFGEDDEHRLMIDVTRGTLGLYQEVLGTHKGPNVIIADFPLRWTVRGMGGLFDTGVNGVIPSQRQIPASYLDPKIKNRSRIHYLMANIQTSQVKGENNWAILLDQNGYLTEGTGSNLFLVKGKTLYSPKPINILRGISRDYVINTLASQLGFSVVEKDLEPYDMMMADEAFLTATPFCLIPVTRLNGCMIGSGKPGEMTLSLLDQWSKNVGVHIPQQIKDWNAAEVSEINAPTPYAFKK
jgi:branched-chain amino acid aminotransferase